VIIDKVFDGETNLPLRSEFFGIFLAELIEKALEGLS
jgi:hypothetical protein